MVGYSAMAQRDEALALELLEEHPLEILARFHARRSNRTDRVGTDRTTCTGDVANKIGTYLKALAAKDNNIPFYVALPSTSFDWEMRDGLGEIPIEKRDAREVTHVDGWTDGRQVEVRGNARAQPGGKLRIRCHAASAGERPHHRARHLRGKRGEHPPLVSGAHPVSKTGAVKFSCEHVRVAPVVFPGFEELNACRRSLLQLRLVGIGRDGIGFGNLSVRDRATNHFFITGSGTGGIGQLEPAHCARVIAYDFARNWLRCEGAAVASSESLTHAALYEAHPGAAAVIHCHSAAIWERLRGVAPAASASAEYGTPEMAREVMRLFATTDVKKTRLLCMAGHEGGIIAFGTSFEDALNVVTGKLSRSQTPASGAAKIVAATPSSPVVPAAPSPRASHANTVW